MASQLELMTEAARRGILPDDKKALFEEAVSRGLVPGIQTPVRETKTDLDQGPVQAAASTAGDIAQTIDDATTGVGQGLTFGFGDEIYAGLTAPFREGNLSQAYERGLNKIREAQRKAQERSPVASTVGEIVGGLTTGAGVGGALFKAARPTVTGSALTSAAEGAGLGALYGFGTGEGQEDRLGRAASGAFFGGVTGGALGTVGGVAARRAARKTIPTTDELKAAKDALYAQSENAGVIIGQPSLQKFAKQLVRDMGNAGLDKTLHPKVLASLNRVLEAANRQGTQGITLKGLDILRQTMKDARASIEPGERRMAKIMLNRLDDFFGGLKGSDLLGGKGKEAINILVQARSMNTRFRKAEQIDDLLERAKNRAGQFSQSGMENSIRTEFRQLAQNKKKMRTFTKDEQKAIQLVARGDMPQLVARWVGKFAPRGIVSTALGGGIGFGAGGPAGSAAVLGAGEIGRQAATSMMRRNVEAVSDLIRSGGNVPTRQLTPAQRALFGASQIGLAQQGPDAAPRIRQSLPFAIAP